MGKGEDWVSSGGDGRARDLKGCLSLLTSLSLVSVEADGKSEISRRYKLKADKLNNHSYFN